MCETTTSIRSFVSFTIDNQLFGVDILVVREINRQLDISMVPQGPDYVRGLINLRGQIVTVLDLRKRIGNLQNQLNSQSHNIIIKNETELAALRSQQEFSDLSTCQDSVGLLVDAVGEVITVSEDEVEAPPANISLQMGQYVSGIIKLESQLMVILNISKVLEPGKAA